MTASIHPSPSPVERADLLDLARRIAVEAAEHAVGERRKGVSVAATKSSPVDIVTAVDRDTEALIRERIRAARPGDAILGEEGDDESGTSGYTWVVDPIDGTVNFVYDIPQWSVSIAVVTGDPTPDRWTQQVGVVCNPSNGEVFTAAAGGGAFLGDRRLRVSGAGQLDQALIATGFSYSAEKRTQQAETLVSLIARVRDIRRLGSCALDISAVATGRLDGFYERGLNAWDFGAATLIAREAGAVVSGVGGGSEGRELTVVATPGIHDELCAALRAGGLPA